LSAIPFPYVSAEFRGGRRPPLQGPGFQIAAFCFVRPTKPLARLRGNRFVTDDNCAYHVFGVKPQLAAAREPEQVRQMFGSIAQRYDLANHVLSCGCDFYWRKRAARMIARWNPRNILDLATGTGDLALILQKQIPNAKIVGADFSEKMLTIAHRKGVQHTVAADAMSLPFDKDSFDCLTIAFGIRNLPDWQLAMQETKRVIKAGGHLVILEFSLPTSPVLRAAYRWYLHRWLPVIGSFLTRQKKAYDYLGDSIENFPTGATMVRLIQSVGFRNVGAEPLTAGIVTIYTGEV
jgi:demethylmenaquinone methyltransferase / 2-methoxy-6-polyprenyl-1,4-benzoquinol methylase